MYQHSSSNSLEVRAETLRGVMAHIDKKCKKKPFPLLTFEVFELQCWFKTHIKAHCLLFPTVLEFLKILFEIVL